MHKPSFRRLLCTLFAAFITMLASAQDSRDSAWQNVQFTKDLAISLPAKGFIQDTIQVKILNVPYNRYYFQLKYLKPPYKVENGDQLIIGYDSFLKGYLGTQQMSVYKHSYHDTTINGGFGEWVHSVYSRDSLFHEFYSFIVLANSHFYIIGLGSNRPIGLTDSILIQYYSSIRFPKDIKEQSGDFHLSARSFRNGQHIGQFVNRNIPYILIGLLIILISIALLIRNRSGRRKTK